jgi:hypothetical protein
LKAWLEFDLDFADEQEQFRRINKSLDMALALHKIQNLKTSAKTRTDIQEIFEEFGIRLEDICS